MRGHALAMLAVAACAIAPRAAAAATRTYVLAIGNNAVPVATGDETLEPLRYADDDAAAFYSFARELGYSARLLTVLDVASQRRFPSLSQVARPPSLVELREAVAQLRARFTADRQAGDEPVLLLFFSGHGTRGGGERAAGLALLDGALTQDILYDEILAALPARYVHLFVDACHAEAVVRPRDLDAKVVPIQPDELATYAARSTLARFPHVGAVVASAAAAQTHEWDAYQRGVFSHEVLSALRGAADVNSDGRIEYSELAAFLGAANRGVADPRARLATVIRPPQLNRRAPLVELTGTRALRLTGQPAALRELHVEDELGNRLVDFHGEPDHRVTLVLPLGRAVFVRHAKGEAQLHATSDEVIELGTLRFAARSTTPRGSVENALQRGLFTTPYGPHYYRGYVDKDEELVAVPTPQPAPIAAPTVERAPPNPRRTAVSLLAVGGTLSVATIVLAGLFADAAASYDATTLERPALEARDRAIGFGVASAITLAVGVATLTVGGRMLARSRRGSFARIGAEPMIRW